MLTIADLQLPSPQVLSSLSGITDLAFRNVARRYGCPFAFFEMFDTHSILYENKKTMNIQMRTGPGDSPLGGQVLGNCPEQVLESALVLQDRGVDLVDLNAGCPVRKVVAKRAGAYLLRVPDLLGKMVETLASRLRVPVTVKIRTGWETEEPDAPEIARILEAAGARAIFVHGRSAQQSYGSPVDYEIIRRVKESVRIPVIGSGNVLSAPLAAKMLDETGCDGVVVARGALGQPWIFREIAQFLQGQPLPPKPGVREILELAADHLRMSVEAHGEWTGVNRMKKQITWYFKQMKGVVGRKKIQNEFSAIDTYEQFRSRLALAAQELLGSEESEA